MYGFKGVFEAYYEMNLKPWDVAAGLIILAEAGGKNNKYRMEKVLICLMISILS